MTALRLLGLIVAVFLLSLPVSFLMHSDLSGWKAFANAKEDGEEKEERDDPVVDVLCIKAMKEMGDGNYTKAIAVYSKAIQRDPNYSFAYLGRGDAYALHGDFNRAEQDYKKALHLDPDNSAARERLILVRMENAGK